jgi:tetratricopeptide (TPR) repeat protein
LAFLTPLFQQAASRSSAEQDLPVEHDRKIQHGRWRDPRTWLREAYRATDRDPADAERYQAPAAISRRGAEVADLAIYHEVERLLTSVIGPDDERNANLLASFYADKALLCFAVHDSEAVFSAADTCIAIRERLVIKQKHREFAADLASAYMHKAIFCKWSGDHVAAQALYDKCISILDPLVEKDGRIDLTADLARAYMNKAVDLTEQGKVKPAIALFDKSIAALRSMGRHGNAEAMNDDLAHVFMNKAGALLHIGNAGGAAESYEMCINIRAPLVERGGRRDLENDLASAYLGRGVALNDLGNYEGAMKMFDQAIQIMERLVVINRNTTLATELARSYLGKANALRDLKNFESAELLYRKACDIWERLVVDEGQRNAANDLANVYMCMANAKRAAGDLRAALQLHEKCIGIRERLIATDENAEVDVDLAKAYMNKGNVLNELGGHTQALAAHDKCIAIYERMVHEQGREELEGLLAEAYANKAAPAKKLGDLQQATSLYEKSITIYERLTRDGRTDKLSELAWAQLSRASVLLASGNMGAEDVVRAREAFKLACRLAEETGQLRAIQLVEWSKQTLRAVLFEGISSATLEFCLPSGLKGCISCAAAIIDFSDVTKWLRCPPGHFWFVTPNVNMSPPPYGPRDEIVLDEVSAPAPQNRREAMEFVHVYIEGDGRGLFWRGDWMDSFHESYPLGPQDKKAWLQWVSTKGEYLDSVLERASREAARAARIKDTVQYGPFARYSLISASEIPRLTNHQSADHSYKLSELVGRSYRLTSGMRQTDYETAINVVAGNLHEQGCRIISTEQDRNAPCSIIAQSPSGSVGVKVVVTRAPDQPQYDQEDVRALREFCTRKADRCAIAPVGLMPGTKRSPEGDQEFYVRYEGLVSV